MKEINYYLSLVVFSVLAFVGIELLILEIYHIFKRPVTVVQNDEVKDVVSVSENIIEAIAPAKPKASKAPKAEMIHSSEAWLLSEKIADNDSSALLFLKETAPEDKTLARYREEAYEARVAIIRESRYRYYRPQSAWGKLVSDTLGSVPYSVLLFSKGIVIHAEGRYHFFHKAAIERNLKDLLKNSKIDVLQGNDGYWYPAVTNNNGQSIPITYWGEIN